jgi:hypothetical protein
MAEITLVRQESAPVTQADRETALRVLFTHVRGLGERGQKQWRGFVGQLLKLGPGEMVTIRTHRERLGWFHRKHMVLETRVFEAQERFDDFEAFRAWLKVGSGFVDWYPRPKGGVIPVPRSISYSKLEQGDMEEVHANMCRFLRTEHALKTLWPKLPATQRFEAIEAVLDEFGAFAA